MNTFTHPPAMDAATAVLQAANKLRGECNNHYVASSGRLAILRHGDSLIHLWTSGAVADADRGGLRQRLFALDEKEERNVDRDAR